jgi:type II pantothenate kinase
VCPIIKAARTAALSHEQAPGASRAASSLVGGPSIPPYPGLRQRQSSAQDLLALAAGNAAAGKGSSPSAAAGGSGGAAVASAASTGSGGLSQGAFGSPLGSYDGSALARECHSKSAPLPSAAAAGGADGSSQSELQQALSNSSSSNGSSFDGSPREGSPAAAAAAAGEPVEPRLFVLGNGSGSPCLDLSRVPAALADATVGVDLLVSGAMIGTFAWLGCDVRCRTEQIFKRHPWH